MADLYRIVRFYKQDHVQRVTGRKHLTLEEAQAHCKDPETSSSTCTKAAGKDHTYRYGPWFDGYEEDPG